METKSNNSCTELTSTKPRLVERRTGLRGLSIGAVPHSAGRIRRSTEEDLRERDAEIPYRKFEAANRDLVCSLMERQDRMNEVLLQKVIDLQYRMDDIEAAQDELSRKTGRKPEAT